VIDRSTEIGDHPGVEPDPSGTWTFWWGRSRNPVSVADEEHLTALLDKASADAATSFTTAELRSPGGAACAIGLGREVSVATFSASYAEPPYYVSHGRLGFSEPLVFFHDGHWTEFEPEAAIPVEVARTALADFFTTGSLPSNVKWTEV
jgi:hypothetical protein